MITSAINNCLSNYMKVSRQKAAENREQLLLRAAKIFREKGVQGVGVDALAAAGGMTHGALYSQFGSKEKLLAAALDRESAKRSAGAVPVETIAQAISLYLSPAHRDNPGHGCFMAALGCDLARQGGEPRSAFTKLVKGNVARLSTIMPKTKSKKLEREVLSIIAAMVGAMVLARAVDDGSFSDEILAATREKLLEDFG